ncbi:hypothetical protein BJY00DRAFT_4267 [Aspergillus carlsbadensis]|nr:hypothetical protein BJY00DRAFT_4267 [Aspergillus carlsbadensis]
MASQTTAEPKPAQRPCRIEDSGGSILPLQETGKKSDSKLPERQKAEMSKGRSPKDEVDESNWVSLVIAGLDSDPLNSISLTSWPSPMSSGALFNLHSTFIQLSSNLTSGDLLRSKLLSGGAAALRSRHRIWFGFLKQEPVPGDWVRIHAMLLLSSAPSDSSGFLC